MHCLAQTSALNRILSKGTSSRPDGTIRIAFTSAGYAGDQLHRVQGPLGAVDINGPCAERYTIDASAKTMNKLYDATKLIAESSRPTVSVSSIYT